MNLIANTGLHFKSMQIEINPEEPMILPDGKPLRYTFLETIDIMNDCKVRVDLCSTRDGQNVPVAYLRDNEAWEIAPNGTVVVDSLGVPKIDPAQALGTMETYNNGSELLVTINSPAALRIRKGHEQFTGFELLQGKWLPMPMYETDVMGFSTGYPNGWCRVRIDALGPKQRNGKQKFRLTWAFDTKLAVDMMDAINRPSFLGGSGEKKTYTLCNRTDLLLGGFINLPDGENDSPVGDYLASLLEINLKSEDDHLYKFVAYYIYLINYLRLCGGAPTVDLYHKTDRTIPVDMSIDIGNSRTCAVLFENGDFTKARMLSVRDLSEPWRSYGNAFDMRVVFRRADFGGDLTLDKTLFQWPSLVRFGEEAKHLVYKAMQNNGESERTTSYSSPKRYLWDDKKFSHRWEFLVIDSDSTNQKVNPQIFIDDFTDYFDDSGNFLEQKKEVGLMDFGTTDQCHYSRSSLMTFVMIELLNQAFCFINSEKFREMHGQIDCRRYLRSIIVTCPTAMPLKEQITLRTAAKNATKLITKLIPELPEISITPDPDRIKPSDDPEVLKQRGWLYDEAFSSQLVYLYAELAERYSGKVDHFFKIKGHERKDMHERGFDGPTLTIGTIDIGAGTTDVMVTAYGQKGGGRLTPVPLYYDSFYSAGDDIIHNIIRDVVLEGRFNDDVNMGSIGSSLTKRIMAMSPDELMQIPRIADNQIYRNAVDDIRHAMTPDIADTLKRHLTNDLMNHFFGPNSANMSEKDRICRLDFCTQISHPMANFFLELLKQNRPTKLYTYDELFPEEKPAQHLLDHFAYHFGFRFEELTWRYEPEYVGNIVKDTMEPIVKAISVVIYALNCDILVLSGRPTNLEPLTELFLKHIPIAPNRLVRLNQYHVGHWFPLATAEGYFQESQKAVVAVGAEVGHLASTVGFNGLVLDFSNMAADMKSTARYIGPFDDLLMEIPTPCLTPESNTTTLKGVSVFPYYIGCKQFNAPKYQARPLYAIYNNSSSPQLNIMLQRYYHDDRETIEITDITDMSGDSIPLSDVELRLQTLGRDGNFWMDKGAFKLRIQENS